MKNIELLRMMDELHEEDFCSFWKSMKDGKYTYRQGEYIDVYSVRESLRQNKILHLMVGTHKGSYWEVVASGHGKTILLIPGFGYVASQWIRQIEAWSKEYNLIIIHPTGAGLSILEDDFSFGNIGNEFMGVLESLGVQWPVHIVSASWGGMIGQTIAALFPEKVASLTLSCSFCEYSGVDDGISVSEKVRMDFNQINMNELYSFALDCEMLNLLELKKFALFSNKGVNTLIELSKISAPTLVVSGKKDCVINPSQSFKLYTRIENSQLLEIDDAGHFPNITHPYLFNEKVIEFVIVNQL